MLRIALYRPGAATPYQRLYLPESSSLPGTAILTGKGGFEVLRGNFPDRGSFAVSAPVPFQHGDWLRCWLPTDSEDAPTYLGVVMGEPWEVGGGEIQTRPVWELLSKSRWNGLAKGRFRAFMAQVLAQAHLPAGVTVPELPDLDSEFRADVPFELLGDTLTAVTPALGGYLIGTNARGELVCVDPGQDVTHRFVAPRSERPPGSTDAYANCVRFSYPLPSGDQGWFEGSNQAEIDRMGGEVWEVSQVSAREVGGGDEPFRASTGTTQQSVHLPNDPTLQETTVTGTVFGELKIGDLPPSGYTSPEPVSSPAQDYQRTYERTHAELGVMSYIRDLLAATLIKQLGFGLEAGFAAANGAGLVANVEVTTLPGWTLNQTLRIGFINSQGGISWAGDDGVVSQRANGLYHHSGGWVEVAGQPGVYEVELSGSYLDSYFQAGVAFGPIPLPTLQARWFVIAYEQAFLDAAQAAGVAVRPILWRGGGGFSYFTDTWHRATVLPEWDWTSIRPYLLQGTDASRPVMRFPMFGSGYSAAYSPAQEMTGLESAGTVLITPAEPLTLPWGSAVEVEVPQGATLDSIRVLHDVDRVAAQTQAARDGKGFAEGVRVALENTKPLSYTIPQVVDGPQGTWKRFAIRRPDTWDGTGTPPETMTLKALLLIGAKKVGRIRIRTPQTDGLTTYAAELLRYRSVPAREWSGIYPTLERRDALGVAAFEVPGNDTDALLDVQKVSYDLERGTVTVTAGTPLPATDDDAVAGAIDRVRFEQRRAGGTS